MWSGVMGVCGFDSSAANRGGVCRIGARHCPRPKPNTPSKPAAARLVQPHLPPPPPPLGTKALGAIRPTLD